MNTLNNLTSLPQLMDFVSEERKRHTVYPPAEQVFTWTQMCNIRDVSFTFSDQHVYNKHNTQDFRAFNPNKTKV